jgi:hypothetical protein
MDAIDAMKPMATVAADDGLASAFGRFYKVPDLARLLKVSPGTLYGDIANYLKRRRLRVLTVAV